MALDTPQRYQSKIELVAQAQQITPNEALDRVLDAGLERLIPAKVVLAEDQPRVSYASLFGSVKNGYGSREAVDRAIAEMRNEW